jgi:sRNA-binding regulator protein Hfq
MKIEVWPFLVGRNRTLGYRSIMSPPFLFEAGVSTLLAEATGGRDSEPDTVTFREIQGSPVGNISLFFRIGPAKGQAYGMEDAEILKDEGGRAIRLIEGFALRGRIQAIDNFVVTHKDFYVTHEAVKHAYHEFWYTTDDSFPEKTSWPFTLFPEDPTNECLVLNTMAPFVVKHTPHSQDYTQQGWSEKRGGVRSMNTQVKIALISAVSAIASKKRGGIRSMNTQVKIALISAVSAIAVAIVSAILGPAIVGHFSNVVPTPTIPLFNITPTPTIPSLHSSYTGTSTRSDGANFALAIVSLSEDTSGNFTAKGGDGSCPAMITGSIGSDGTINFALSEYQEGMCGFRYTFIGKLYPDSHLAGQWQGGMNRAGTWAVS